MVRAGFTPSGAPCSEKCGGHTPPILDCLHPTRTVVIIDILLRTRAAMHTTIATAAIWKFEASL